MKRKIVVVGSSNTDMIVNVTHIPKPGETVLGGRFAMAAGGKGANQAVAASRAGGTVAFIAAVGADLFGDQALSGFRADHIDVTHVKRISSAASGVALIFVSQNGENCIGVASGANALVTPADIDAAAPLFNDAAVLLLQLETPLETVEQAARLAASNGCRVILNPAPAQPLPDSLLRHVSILTPNESEAALLTGLPVTTPAEAEKAAAVLRKKGVREVLITLGSRGVLIATEQGMENLPSFKVNAVDTVAAGDTFNGALAVGLSESMPLRDAARFASAAAAISVTRHGAQPSAPKREEIERMLKGGVLGET